mmetsp:Transcript_94879/g.284330  ORF Transcript_94879/g.284330 Transcript_94879/m.284330 type:complete len:215 (-) Transcript_94879:247-891(-)
MQATAYGSPSFCVWIAQLRSMSLTDAPPKTRSSGSPTWSWSVPSAFFAASLKRRLTISVQPSTTPMPQPFGGIRRPSPSVLGFAAPAGPAHGPSRHAAAESAGESAYSPSPPCAFGYLSRPLIMPSSTISSAWASQSSLGVDTWLRVRFACTSQMDAHLVMRQPCSAAGREVTGSASAGAACVASGMLLGCKGSAAAARSVVVDGVRSIDADGV